jgi:indolepyruvate decarboxylase
MTMTVIQHVLARLKDIGITDVFGVSGDYSFPVNDAICNDPAMRWIGCCNEQNAAYAADGYARIKGVGALCTTFGVGELSALNGIAGAYAEHLPLFHLVGTPNLATQSARAVMHHTLGDGEYDLFRRMTEPVVCAQAVMTPRNVAWETERLIAEARYHRRPVYMAFPTDAANQPVLDAAAPLPAPRGDATSLEAAANAIVEALSHARSACVLPGILVARTCQRAAMNTVIEASNLPFATVFMAKSVLDEQHPNYVGIYDGALMNPEIRDFVEGCDQVLVVGSMMSGFSTGAFTARLDPTRAITIRHHRTEVGGRTYPNVEIGELLATLARRLPKRDWPRIRPRSAEPVVGTGRDPITAEALYPRWGNFLRANDILIAETGTVSMGLGFARLPRGATFHNQTLWGAIGWATPAALGAAIAAPERRVVLVTGDGAHQFTAQEISQFDRFGPRPIIFVLNNDGYLIERLLCKDPAIAYNDIARWRYAELPHALGCNGWFTARATTCGELDLAMERAARSGTAAYIEVVTSAYAASPLAAKLDKAVNTLYTA